MNPGFVFPFGINPPYPNLVLTSPINNGYLVPVHAPSYLALPLKFRRKPADWLDVGVVRVLFGPPDSGGPFFKTCDPLQQTARFTLKHNGRNAGSMSRGQVIPETPFLILILVPAFQPL
jgi:hypothetical protein